MKTRCLYVNHSYGYEAEYLIIPANQTEEDVLMNGCKLYNNQEINRLEMKQIAMKEFPEALLEEEHDELRFGQKGYFKPYICLTSTGFTIRRAYDD